VKPTSGMVTVLDLIIPNNFENLYFTRMNISGSKKTNGNNKLTNLTININSQHIQHDVV